MVLNRGIDQEKPGMVKSDIHSLQDRMYPEWNVQSLKITNLVNDGGNVLSAYTVERTLSRRVLHFCKGSGHLSITRLNICFGDLTMACLNN